jgi:hypothetical protein
MAPGRISFWSVMTNAFPQILTSSRGDADLSSTQMDNVVKLQLCLKHARYLDAHSLLFAGVVDHEKMGVKVHRLLVKHDYILPAPAPGDPVPSSAETPLTVNTLHIGRNFSHQMSIISQHAHRKLVSLLFFWEEEVNRWRVLDREEVEIQAAMGALEGYAVEDLKVALEAVRIRKRLLPSERAEGAAGGMVPPRQEALPTYV